ncbi:MAG: class I SAM-dependent methyltransferase [bacterium]|nr:class I SAM-dependent methyltransferase [bacterium]
MTRQLVTDVLIDDGMDPAEARGWARWLTHVYRGVDFHGKTVLDVGAGNGVHALHAAAAGAAMVVCLEPGAAGGNPAALQTLQRRSRLAAAHGLPSFGIETIPFDDFPSTRQFDVILCFAVINHFAEDLVPRLPTDSVATAYYTGIFGKLSRHLTNRGLLVVSDVSPRNALRLLAEFLGIPHPLAPTINLRSHQPPEVWVDLARAGGLAVRGLRWIIHRRLLPFGGRLVWLIGRGLLTSHFTLFFERTPTTSGGPDRADGDARTNPLERGH